MANNYQLTTGGLVPNPTAQSAIAAIGWAVASGTANALTATFTPANLALTDGLAVGVRSLFANTSGTVTLNVDGLGNVNITKLGGLALLPGDIVGANQEMILRYNLANNRWELLNPALDYELFKLLSADDTGGQNISTTQPWFPTAGGVTLAAGTYFFEGLLWTTRAAGTTSHTTGLFFGGSAVVSAIDYFADVSSGDVANQVADTITWGNTTGTVLVKAADTTATENIVLHIKGTVRITTAGTFIPQFIYSAAPGGAPTIKRGSFFRLIPQGGATIVSNGTWA